MSDKILVIDDDADLALMTAIWVRSAGYAAHICRDGISGLAEAESYRPDLILLDIMMPGMDGFEVSWRLKQSPHLAHIPVIFLSAKVQENAQRESFSAGGKFFLRKPFEADELMFAITFALSSSRTGAL